MLRPSFELVRIIIVQYSFVYIVQMQKIKIKTKTRKKHKLCAVEEQIPPFRIAFQKLDEC